MLGESLSYICSLSTHSIQASFLGSKEGFELQAFREAVGRGERVVTKIEAGSQGTVSALGLEPGDSGTPRPGSGLVAHSWELRMEPCGSLPASSGSFPILLDSPPLCTKCSVCPSPRSLTGGNGSNVGKQRVGRNCCLRAGSGGW